MRAPQRVGLVAASLAFAAGVAACIVQIEIVHEQAVALDVASPVVAATWSIDLSQEFQVVLHRAAIAVVRTEVITLTVGTVGEENRWRHLSGTLKARPAGGAAGGREFLLGAIEGLPVRTGAQVVLKFGLRVKPEDSSGTTFNEFMVEVLRGDGLFDLVLEGAADDAPGHVELRVELDLQMGHET